VFVRRKNVIDARAMDQMDIRFGRYLKETLDIHVRPKKWKEAGKLPFFLRKRYAYFGILFIMVDIGIGRKAPVINYRYKSLKRRLENDDKRRN